MAAGEDPDMTGWGASTNKRLWGFQALSCLQFCLVRISSYLICAQAFPTVYSRAGGWVGNPGTSLATHLPIDQPLTGSLTQFLQL